jgi:hypothetical protein
MMSPFVLSAVTNLCPFQQHLQGLRKNLWVAVGQQALRTPVSFFIKNSGVFALRIYITGGRTKKKALLG